jgi:hypothetical protein
MKIMKNKDIKLTLDRVDIADRLQRTTQQV